MARVSRLLAALLLAVLLFATFATSEAKRPKNPLGALMKAARSRKGRQALIVAGLFSHATLACAKLRAFRTCPRRNKRKLRSLRCIMCAARRRMVKLLRRLARRSRRRSRRADGLIDDSAVAETSAFDGNYAAYDDQAVDAGASGAEKLFDDDSYTEADTAEFADDESLYAADEFADDDEFDENAFDDEALDEESFDDESFDEEEAVADY
ncbi:hypothetical protein HK405_006960 [Cladochytrium tenue]|nr:hypothetical protein HK405_006960 [Cladochytrium tenue]